LPYLDLESYVREKERLHGADACKTAEMGGGAKTSRGTS
ncbi:hypothetical protein A2U01_0072008, partial [Trifolium medium]|nr:hypothetical protein [Trifolium medium]